MGRLVAHSLDLGLHGLVGRGVDVAVGLPNRQVPEVEGGDRKADQEVGEEEGGSRWSHPRSDPEEEDGSGRGEAEKY